MKIKIYLAIAFLLYISSMPILQAQTGGDIALKINDKPIYKRELEAAFKEQSKLPKENQQTLDSFINSYTIYKLNLEEAHNQQLDTTSSFKKDLRSYEIQLQNLYLKDTITENQLVDKILKRFEYELEVNHAFIPFKETSLLAKDTIKYYKQALEAREVALSKGFEEVIKESIANPFGVILDVENETGYLGWIQPLFFQQDLEEILYNLELGVISMPIRTVKGYHIFQVLNKRPMQGNPVVEQILFGFPIIPAPQHVQDSVYKVAMSTFQEISLHDNFQLICDEFSEVFQTGDRGCLLGELTIGTQVPLPLIQAAYQLKNVGDVSNPVMTAYGYHILRLKDKKDVPSQKNLRAGIKEGLTSEKIFPRLLDRQREKLIERNTVQINYSALDKLHRVAMDCSPGDSMFNQAVTNKKDVLVSIGNGAEEYSVQEFLEYLEINSWVNKPIEEDPFAMIRVESMVKYIVSSDIIDSQFNAFMYLILSKYERDTLKDKNPEYARTIQNISDGLLNTLLLEKEIWKRAKTDTKGLTKTFEQNKNKYTLDNEMFKGMIIHSKSDSVISEIEEDVKTRKLSSSELTKKYNESSLVIHIESGLWSEGDNPCVDTKIFEAKNVGGSKMFPYYTVIGALIDLPQEYRDVQVQVETDYQKQLETEWESYLKSKYKVESYKAVIKKIK